MFANASIHLQTNRVLFQILSETFTMDYKTTLHFWIIPEEVEVQPANPANAKITIPHVDETIKGFYISFHSTVHIHCLLPQDYIISFTYLKVLMKN